MDFEALFPDERAKGETRLRQCQFVMLRMLKILDYLCAKYDIEYFLTGGSLLGAVRHKGFIPWDDDLDVGMTRENYEKFVQYAIPLLPNDIFFQSEETDIYPSCHLVESKLRDKYSSYVRNYDEIEKSKPHKHDGIQLDIFVYDKAYLPHNFFIYALNRFLRFWQHKGNDRRTKTLKFISKYIPYPFVYASSFICNRDLMRLGTNYIRSKEISKLIRTRFEDMEVSIPQGWHTCLKRQYDNYMQLPPVEQQMPLHSEDVPDPFTPCEHSEILHWKDREVNVVQ